MKLLLILLPLMLGSVAFGRPFTGVGSVSLEGLHKNAPVREFYSYCRAGSCVIISHNPQAPYGFRFELIFENFAGKRLYENFKALGVTEVPDAIGIIKVGQESFDKLIGIAEPIPPPENLPETDKKIGYKLLYCAGAGAGCLYSVKDLFTKVDGIIGILTACSGTHQTCSDFKEAWDKEREYYKALEQYNKDHGMGPKSPGTGSSSTSSTGASSGGGTMGSNPGGPGSGAASSASGGSKEPKWSVYDAATDTWVQI